MSSRCGCFCVWQDADGFAAGNTLKQWRYWDAVLLNMCCLCLEFKVVAVIVKCCHFLLLCWHWLWKCTGQSSVHFGVQYAAESKSLCVSRASKMVCIGVVLSEDFLCQGQEIMTIIDWDMMIITFKNNKISITLGIIECIKVYWLHCKQYFNIQLIN